MEESPQESGIATAAEPEAFTYVRRKPPSQDCEAEKMITIEPISLRRGGWRHMGISSTLRHIDPQIGVVIFYAVMTSVIFFLYWRKYKSLLSASIYTTSSITMLGMSFAAAFGIDPLAALGSTILAHW